MARQEIDLTTPQPNGKMGEPTKAAWEKVNDMTAEIYSSPAMAGSFSGQNLLINCGIPINQRGFAGGALAAGVYGYDRWKGGVGGCNFSINSTNGVFSHNSGSIRQIIENPQSAWGNQLTFSVEDPSGSIQVSVGGATGTISAGSGRRSVTLSPTGSGNMDVIITASGVTYSRPKLERGPAATRFAFSQVSSELLICQRYYEKSYEINTIPGTATRIACYNSSALSGYLLSSPVVRFCVLKRAIPSIGIYNTQNGSIGQLSENDTGGSHTFNKPAGADFISTVSFEAFVSNGTATPGNIERFHWVAECEL